MRWKLALAFLLLPLAFLLPLERIPEPTAPQKEYVQKPWRIEPTETVVALVCLHRATIDGIKAVLERDLNGGGVKPITAKAIKDGECWKLPEPTMLKIEEYGGLGDVIFPVPDEDSRWSKRVVLFEAVRVRNFWTLLEVPLLTN